MSKHSYKIDYALIINNIVYTFSAQSPVHLVPFIFSAPLKYL